MKKTQLKIVLLSFALALLFALAGAGKEAKAAKPAYECSYSDGNVTISAETCGLNNRSVTAGYKDVEITFENNTAQNLVWIRYFDGRNNRHEVALAKTDAPIAAGESQSFIIPVEYGNLTYVEFDYELADASMYQLPDFARDPSGNYLYFQKDAQEPYAVAEVQVGAIEGYNKEVKYLLTYSESQSNASGLAEIKYELADKDATLDGHPELFTGTIQAFIDSDEVYAGTGAKGVFTHELSVNTTGEYRLWLYAKDYAGNETYWSQANTYKVDGDKPIITVDKTSGERAVYHDVNVNVIDGLAGLKSVKYAWKMSEETWDEVEFKDLELVAGNATIQTPNANATYQYKIIAEDNAGNVEVKESGDFVVLSGTAAVTLEFVGDTSKAAKEFQVVVRVAAGSTADVEKIVLLWIPNGTNRPVDSSVAGYNFVEEYEIVNGVDNEHTFSTANFAELNDGVYVVSMLVIQASDPLTFYLQHEGRHLTVDKTAPTVSFAPAGSNVYAREVSSTPTVVDANGINEAIMYMWAEASAELIKEDITNNGVSGTAVPFTGETGSYRLWVLAYDEAGNEVIAHSEAFLIDTTAPTVVLGTIKEFYTQGDEIEVNFADAHSGVDQVAYVLVAAGAEEPADEAYKASATKKVYMDVRASGSYKLYVKVVDAAGNVTTVGFAETFIVDVEAPEVEGVEASGYYTADTAVKVTDANLKEVTLNGQASEAEFSLTTTGVYHLVAKDIAGNVTRVDFIVNKEGKANINNEEYNVKRQILLPVLKVEDEAKFYIVLPKGNYEKGDVLVMTKEAGETTKMLEQGSSYIVIKENVIEVLSRRSDSYTVADKEFTDAEVNEAGNYGWVIVDLMSNEEARGLGINTTVIDNEAIALTAGIAGVLSLIAVFVIYRSKRTVRL